MANAHYITMKKKQQEANQWIQLQTRGKYKLLE